MTLRTATEADIPAIMKILEAGRDIMRASGNLHQWPQGYPTEEMVRRDIGPGYGKVMEDGGRIVAYFACIPSPDPTYAVIYDGAWEEDEKPYYVVHRIASFPQVHGVFKTMMEYLDALTDNIRIDTHKDNKIMQHNLAKYGFKYCGIIHIASGAERLAYQRIRV
jgi:ribosomal protein S18 acetylase RimI-like enzyme